MAYTNISVPAGTWTKIIDNKSTASFQNVGQVTVMILYTSTDYAPADDSLGLEYGTRQGEIKRELEDLTFVEDPLYAWAKPVTGNATTVRVEVETA